MQETFSAFLTSVDGCKWSASRSLHFITEENIRGNPWIGGSVDTRRSSEEKIRAIALNGTPGKTSISRFRKS
jgi:hypothetical protein